MRTPSKKTIKRIDRILQNKCKYHRTFGNTTKVYHFRRHTEFGLESVTFRKKDGYFVGISLEGSGIYNFFAIYSPEQAWEAV